MGPDFSIYSVVFLGGFLLFVVIICLLAASVKSGRGITLRLIALLLFFVVAIVLMVTPTVIWSGNLTYSNEQAFRMFFGRKPDVGVKFVNNATRGGVNYVNILLSLELDGDGEFQVLADTARLECSPKVVIPDTNMEMPVWWTPGTCASSPLVCLKAPDSNWDEKWATYCADSRRVNAFALWNE